MVVHNEFDAGPAAIVEIDKSQNGPADIPVRILPGWFFPQEEAPAGALFFETGQLPRRQAPLDPAEFLGGQMILSLQTTAADFED